MSSAIRTSIHYQDAFENFDSLMTAHRFLAINLKNIYILKFEHIYLNLHL